MGWNHDPDAIHSHQSGEIQALTEKTTPVDADVVVIEDSEDSNKKKKVKVANLGGGAETLDDLTDVDTTGVADGDALVYDADTSTWVPGEGGGGNASYSETVGDAAETTFNIAHSLDSSAVAVEVIEVSTGDALTPGTDYTWSVTDDDTIQVVFDTAPAADDALVVVLASGGTAGGGGSSWGDLILPGNAPSGLDIAYEFDDADDLNDFTLVTVSGNATWDVAGDTLSVLYEGQTSGDAAAALVAIPGTPAAPYEIRTAVRTAGIGNHQVVGLLFTNGVAPSSGSVMFRVNAVDGGLQMWGGTLTNLQNSVLRNPGTLDAGRVLPWLHMRLRWVSANTWRLGISVDGKNYTALASADASHTLTPTHVGVFVSRFGSSAGNQAHASFEYLRGFTPS